MARKAPHKSPFNEEIYQAWEPIAFASMKMSVEDRIAMWSPLYERYSDNGALPLPAVDAALLTSLGWSLMMQSGNYVRAEEMCEAFLSLPDAKSDEVSYESHRAWHADSLLLQGRVDEAVSEYRDLLQGKKMSLVLVRNGIRQVLNDVKDGLAIEQLRMIVRDLYRRLPGYGPYSSDAAAANTAEELAAVMDRAREQNHPNIASLS